MINFKPRPQNLISMENGCEQIFYDKCEVVNKNLVKIGNRIVHIYESRVVNLLYPYTCHTFIHG